MVEQHFTVVIKDFIQYHYFLYRYGSGSGPIWLDDVGCFGSESCLISCSNRGIGSHNCGHSEDVAISCSGTRLLSADCSFISTSKYSTVPFLQVGNLLHIDLVCVRTWGLKSCNYTGTPLLYRSADLLMKYLISVIRCHSYCSRTMFI